MKERILLVGEDPVLQATRALLLSDWDNEINNSHEALAVLRTGRFDVVIVGQSVLAQRAREIIALAATMSSPPVILVIRNQDEMADFGVETHRKDLLENPGWLKSKVIELLAVRRSAMEAAAAAISPVMEQAALR